MTKVLLGNIKGPKGDKGDKGDAGATGIQGATGPQGPPGSATIGDGSITAAKIANEAVTDAKIAPGAAIAPSKINALTEYIQDAVAAFLTAGTNITLTYNDAGNSLTIAASGGGGGSLGGLAVVVFDGIAWGNRPDAPIVMGISTRWPSAGKPPWMTSGQNDGDIWLPDPDQVLA